MLWLTEMLRKNTIIMYNSSVLAPSPSRNATLSGAKLWTLTAGRVGLRDRGTARTGLKVQKPSMDKSNVHHSFNLPITFLLLLQPSAPPLGLLSLFSSFSSLCSFPFSRVSSKSADVLCRVMIQKLTKEMIANVVNPGRI